MGKVNKAELEVATKAKNKAIGKVVTKPANKKENDGKKDWIPYGPR